LTKSGAMEFVARTFTLFVMTATSCLISLDAMTVVPLSDTLALEARCPPVESPLRAISVKGAPTPAIPEKLSLGLEELPFGRM